MSRDEIWLIGPNHPPDPVEIWTIMLASVAAAHTPPSGAIATPSAPTAPPGILYLRINEPSVRMCRSDRPAVVSQIELSCASARLTSGSIAAFTCMKRIDPGPSTRPMSPV